MILTCNECDTKFMIKAEDLGDKGRRVRCGNCAAIWFVKPPAAEAVKEEKQVAQAQEENLKEAVAKQAAGVKPSLPAVYEPVEVPKWLKAAVIILVVINIGAFIFLNKKLIGQTSFYDMVGQYQTSDVVIKDAGLVVGTNKKGDKTYAIKATIVNNSKEHRQLPVQRIKVLDKDLAVISSGANKSGVDMAAGEEIELPPSKLPDDSKSKYVVLEIGNAYELKQR